MLPKIAVLAACDRFNYGDLLFPVILEQMLRGCRYRGELEFYSTRASNWARFGGKPTRSLGALFQPNALPDGSALILAGGDILGETFAAALNTLLPAALALGLRRLANRVREGGYEAYCRHLVGVDLEYPWVIAPDDFRSRVQVVYNSVGGSGLCRLSADALRRIADKLIQANFLSVRDLLTQAALARAGPHLPILLAPDCAVLLSHFYPVHELRRKLSPHTPALCEAFNRGYVCFQINKRWGSAHLGLLTAELEQVYRRYGLGALLLPIGRARNHEDQVPLARIAKDIRTPVVYAGTKLSIYDIMYLIARARAFVGTSLHGNITAISYAVPHLGLTESVPKLASFLTTWELPSQQKCVPLEGFSARLEDLFLIPRSRLEEKRGQLIEICLRNMAAMFASIDACGEPGRAAMPT